MKKLYNATGDQIYTKNTSMMTPPIGIFHRIFGGGKQIRGIRKRHDVVKDLIVHPRSRSEGYVIGYLEVLTGQKFPTVNPAWLVWGGSQLELDGYNGVDLALEFSGPLHTKWYPAKEPYEKYFQRIVRDVAKRKICAKKGVKLIVVDASLPRHQWELYVKSRLYDFTNSPKPEPYIAESVVEPYHNVQLERELGLTGEWEMVHN